MFGKFYFFFFLKIKKIFFFFFFFNDTATTEIYTLSLHDALPICFFMRIHDPAGCWPCFIRASRSEEHTSELQSPKDLVCRLLLEKKKKKKFRKHRRKQKNGKENKNTKIRKK